MKKGYTHITVVLDRSGSMYSIKSDTIGGFNTFLKGQKAVEGTATFTLAQFDDEYQIVYNMINIKDVPELTDETFVPRGMTALYDAVCRTIDKVGRELHAMRESQKPEKVVFVIITDGHENASLEFSVSQMRDKIGEQRDKYNWEFVFLAANQDAVESAHTYNIEVGNAMTYSTTAQGVQNMFVTMDNKMASYRTGAVANMAYTTEEREEQEKINSQ